MLLLGIYLLTDYLQKHLKPASEKFQNRLYQRDSPRSQEPANPRQPEPWNIPMKSSRKPASHGQEASLYLLLGLSIHPACHARFVLSFMPFQSASFTLLPAGPPLLLPSVHLQCVVTY